MVPGPVVAARPPRAASASSRSPSRSRSRPASGVMHLRSDPVPKDAEAFVAGKGVTYTSPDGSFQVQLPQQPVLDTHDDDRSTP